MSRGKGNVSKLALLGMTVIFFGCVNEYFGIVIAHLEPQPVDAIHNAVFGINELKNAKQIVIEGGAPNCTYYRLHLHELMSEIAIAECSGATDRSDTRWGYWISFSGGPRSNPEVERAIEYLLKQVERTIYAVVGPVKVTKAIN